MMISIMTTQLLYHLLPVNRKCAVKGVKFEFATYPKRTIVPREYNSNTTEVIIIDKQI